MKYKILAECKHCGQNIYRWEDRDIWYHMNSERSCTPTKAEPRDAH